MSIDQKQGEKMDLNLLEKEILASPAAKHWKTIGIRHHHGLNIPLFSLHSHHSCGIGEFTDLLPLVTWCHELGIDIIQLLPLNDTGLETSPYCALSAFALNPIHLGLAALPHVADDPKLEAMMKELKKLNQTPRVAYPQVQAGKMRFLHEYYSRFSHLVVETDEYKKFLGENSWLKEFALFKALKIHTNWQSWSLWPKKNQNIDEKRYHELLQEFKAEVDYHVFVQYLCFKQFSEVKQKVNKKGVFLKGDIPILISRESADVWFNSSLFHLDLCAGAPPDAFLEEGQNWNIPIYNWDLIKKQHYSWWKARLKTAACLYDLYRLDHVVGFFRFWVIPAGCQGNKGCFLPKEPSKWIPEGIEILKALLEASHMLPIAEDLGDVPSEVRVALRSLGICGTKVIRWERNWDTDKEFIPFEDYSPLSMTTVSTHDLQLLQEWWRENREEAHEFAKFKHWEYSDGLHHEQHLDLLKESHRSASLFHINLLNEYLALVPGMTANNLKNERINVPGIVSDHNWSYRFRPSVEDIVSNVPLRRVMGEIFQ